MAMLTLYMGRQFIPVDSYADASTRFRLYIEQNGYGASDLDRGDGDICDSTSKVIAHVSYNGKVWRGKARDWTTSTERLH